MDTAMRSSIPIGNTTTTTASSPYAWYQQQTATTQVGSIPTQVVHHNVVPVQQTVVTQQPVLLQPPPRQPVVLHHVHGEPGKAFTGGMGADVGRAQNALPPGVIPEHVTEELITEHHVGRVKKGGRLSKRHEETYHRELDLARAELQRAAEAVKLGNMPLHDECVARALAHQKEAERHLDMTFKK